MGKSAPCSNDMVFSSSLYITISDKFAVMTTQHHDNKCTCLVVKLQDSHLVHDGK